jgi:hypothetical protein
MKTAIKTTGSVELSSKEVLEAVRDFNKKDNGYLLKAIDNYLATKLNVSAKKLQYNDDVFIAIVEGGTNDEIKPFGGPIKEKEERSNPGGHKRRFVGFFDTVRGIIQDARKAKKKELTFEELAGELKSEFKGIEDWRIKGYLNDVRQLKGVSWDGRKGILTL